MLSLMKLGIWEVVEIVVDGFQRESRGPFSGRDTVFVWLKKLVDQGVQGGIVTDPMNVKRVRSSEAREDEFNGPVENEGACMSKGKVCVVFEEAGGMGVM